jgi:DNA-binding NarL/FixJ family response regulator
VPVVLVAPRHDPAYAALVAGAGVRGLVRDTAAPTELRAAARAVADGGRHLPPGDGSRHPYLDLGLDERDLLRHALEGLPPYRLAYDRHLTTAEVNERLASIYARLGGRDRPTTLAALRSAGVLAPGNARRPHAVLVP